MANDDRQIFAIRRDISGGINSRQRGTIIKDEQVRVLYNADISVPGETAIAPGLTLVEDLGNSAGVGLFGFEPNDGTNELIALESTNLKGWTGSGSFTSYKTDFTNGTPTRMLKAGESGENDVLLVYMSGNNWFRMNQSHTFQDLGNTAATGIDSPPASDVALYYRNRLWILKDEKLYFSAAFPADYSTAFDTQAAGDFYNINCGEERQLVAIRDQGIVVIGEDSVWGINPSATPAATDKAEKLIDIGSPSKKSAALVGDDIIYLAHDGVRGLFRTQQDKLQSGSSYPISYPLKTEFDAINFAQISKASAIYFDNKYFLSLPTGASTYNNQVWVYFPATQGWVVLTGWEIADWGIIGVDGEKRLYGIEANDGKVHRCWSGFTNNGTAIQFQEEGRIEDFQQPLVSKFGGEFKLSAYSEGDYQIDVYTSIDGDAFTLLGQMDLDADAPTLPVDLPVDLVGSNAVEQTFSIDSLGEFRTFQYKLLISTASLSDEVKIYERSTITFANEYTP